MKVYVNIVSKRVNLSVEMSEYITLTDSKLVKTWMADTKNLLEGYVNEMIAKAENDLDIGLTDVYDLSATYYNSSEMPVVVIVGRGYDRRPGSDLGAVFVEAFVDDSDCRTTENRYTRAC